MTDEKQDAFSPERIREGFEKWLYRHYDTNRYDVHKLFACNDASDTLRRMEAAWTAAMKQCDFSRNVMDVVVEERDEYKADAEWFPELLNIIDNFWDGTYSPGNEDAAKRINRLPESITCLRWENYAPEGQAEPLRRYDDQLKELKHVPL